MCPLLEGCPFHRDSSVILYNMYLGAGLGTFLTFATFMRRSQGAVKLGSMTPFFNNVVSMMCGILVFSTVFSVQRQEGAQVEDIVGTLRFNGPGNTGLTFIWYDSYSSLPNSIVWQDILTGGGL